MSATLYYWDGVSPVQGYGSVKDKGGAEILFNTAKNHHFKNKKESLILVVEDTLVLLDGKMIPLSGYLGEMQITKEYQDKVTLNDLYISKIPRINTKLYQKIGFDFGTLTEYREAYNYMAFNKTFQDALDRYSVSINPIYEVIPKQSDGSPTRSYGISYKEGYNHYVEVRYDTDAFVREICIDGEHYSVNDKLVYTELMHKVNRLLDSKDDVPAAPTLFDVCINTLVADAGRYTEASRMHISIDYQHNRPYLTLGDAGRQISDTIVIPSTYGTDYCGSCYTRRKWNKAPALIDVNTLTTALYDRFHEDGQANNITMVPLGEVIQFIKEMPAIDKESTVESEIESEQQKDTEYEEYDR